MARANENVNVQGNRDLNRTFMAFKWAEASSAGWPPDKNAMPGTAAGTARKRHFTVAAATASTAACLGQVNPGGRIRRSESPASNSANLMLDEPPLIVRMRGLVGFMEDAVGVKLYPHYLGIDGIETDLTLKYVLLAMSPNLHFPKAQRRHFAAPLVV